MNAIQERLERAGFKVRVERTGSSGSIAVTTQPVGRDQQQHGVMVEFRDAEGEIGAWRAVLSAVRSSTGWGHV